MADRASRASGRGRRVKRERSVVSRFRSEKNAANGGLRADPVTERSPGFILLSVDSSDYL